MNKQITYKPFGTKAILIEWKAIIDQEILNDIIQFKENISAQQKEDYTDFMIAYNSLTIIYKEEVLDFKKEVEKLQSIYKSNVISEQQEAHIWEIPVCYDVKFGIDLQEISEVLKVSIEEIIQLHSEKIYTVFFIGFLPGFLYLGGLDEKIIFDRKENPRLQVDKGAVAIGGKQTGIYPSNSAGGWNIIGKTPLNFFDVQKENPCFAKAGDQIQFKPISVDAFYQLEKEVTANTFIISKTLQHD
ncbi:MULTISPECIES: 5-oxoprolinase subunit PxpB [unclassified Polaribacter]|uniref:5-oxoprolinase subunit PxpB n=1 Tax=unclassified Polaribacter TaxID=196858 RepID=UPI0011BDED42|nr:MULTISPECIES: 5-oxoprolinase subunit PxpB [unclassified Polaribacter]TXD50921.1 5-oxoprolinase subunit PxpB [Polaribacter sp. IC063]TXD62286.1 5-oxoprolinase subunit PxpB [Polaribacter sp. IC066]